ncbi:tetratricopeptide repeat protein [Candidatus Parcubacteria bacterium]|jgi:tetratricopeptide (TPR) repeat protein|nr:tetratricopeptide repeat protein [Candidatus Parcubacteria bacterium]
MFDIILIGIAVVALIFIIWSLLKKFPLLTNVNVDSLPDIRVQRQKEAILKSRMLRGWLELWNKAKGLTAPTQDKVNNIFKQYYNKLKSVEKDLKRRGHQQLSSAVDKSQAVEEMITEAKQLVNSEEYKKAEDILLDAVSVEQHNVDAYKLLAEVYRCRKEFVQAKETLEYLLKITHNADAGIYSSLANIARERGNLKQAEEDYIKSISLSDDNYLHFLSLAEVYLDLEEEDKAFKIAQRALVLSPNNPKILDFLINISIIMQDKELAQQYLERLKEVNPDNNKILSFIERIDNLK